MSYVFAIFAPVLSKKSELVMEKTILAISGKSGLFQLISRGRGMLIVEAVDETKKRMPVGARDRVTALNEVSMYTESDDKPLMEVFENIRKKENGNTVPLDPRKASKEELSAYMAEILPDYDKDRVYTSDIKRLIQWYNILVTNGISDFVPSEETEA